MTVCKWCVLGSAARPGSRVERCLSAGGTEGGGRTWHTAAVPGSGTVIPAPGCNCKMHTVHSRKSLHEDRCVSRTVTATGLHASGFGKGVLFCYPNLCARPGVNGAGKTTQLQIIMGRLQPDSGEVIKAKRKMKIAYLAQEFDVNPSQTVREEFTSVYNDLLKVRDTLLCLHYYGIWCVTVFASGVGHVADSCAWQPVFPSKPSCMQKTCRYVCDAESGLITHSSFACMCARMCAGGVCCISVHACHVTCRSSVSVTS